MFCHDLGPVEALKLGQAIHPAEMPKHIILFGVEIADATPGVMSLSDPVLNAVPELIQQILHAIQTAPLSHLPQG